MIVNIAQKQKVNMDNNQVSNPIPESPPQPIPDNSVVASPTPTPTPSSTIEPAYSPAQQYPMSASQMGWSQQGKTKFNSKKLAIKAAIALVVVGGVFTALVLTNIIPLSKFKTVNYDNGKGTSFSLKFYSKHTLKNVAQSSYLPSESSISPELQQLASKVSVNGKYPLVLWAQSNESTAPSFSNNDCTRNNLPKVFDARIDFINDDAAVCAVKAQDKDLIYLVTFHHSNKGYLVYIAQDIDFQKATSSPEKAQDTLTKAGLADYQDDIKTILASLKPIN